MSSRSGNPQDKSVGLRQRHRFLIDLAIPLVLLGLVTAACWIWPLDISMQSDLYDAGSATWPNADNQPYYWLYHYGNFPALALALASLILFALSFRKGRLHRWRKVALFFILTLILGPALLVNLTLKEHWGRPRPRDVDNFGGKYAYERPLEYDASSPGKSFPCGHCSMAFVFMSGFLLLRPGHRMAAWTWLLLSAGYGALMGAARMNQGAHFFSDVVWSGGVCYLSAVLVFYLLGMNRGILLDPPPLIPARRRAPLWVTFITAALALGALFGILLNTPYQENLAYAPKPPALSEKDWANFSLHLEPGDHRVFQNGDKVAIASSRDGFGLPGSGIRDAIKESADDEPYYFQLKQRTSGLLIEIKHKIIANLPISTTNTNVRWAQHGGSLELAPVAGSHRCKWKLELGGLDQLTLVLSLDEPVRVIWQGSMPPSLMEVLKPVPGDNQNEWQLGDGRPMVELEFQFDGNPPKDIVFKNPG